MQCFYARPGQRALRISGHEGLNQELVGVASLAAGEGLVGLVAERGEPVNLEDAENHPSFRFLPGIGEEHFHAFLGVPIIHQRGCWVCWWCSRRSGVASMRAMKLSW